MDWLLKIFSFIWKNSPVKLKPLIAFFSAGILSAVFTMYIINTVKADKEFKKNIIEKLDSVATINDIQILENQFKMIIDTSTGRISNSLTEIENKVITIRNVLSKHIENSSATDQQIQELKLLWMNFSSVEKKNLSPLEKGAGGLTLYKSK